jgi:hypothetical protein
MNEVQQEEQRIWELFRLRALDSLRLGGLQDLSEDLRSDAAKREYDLLIAKYGKVR